MEEIRRIGKLKYIGEESFFSEEYNMKMYADLKNNKTYECVGIEDRMLRIIDESGEDYLYNPKTPINPFYPLIEGKWEIVEDNEKQELYKVIYG